MRPDPPLPQVFTTTDLDRLGLTQEQAERRVAAGRWHRLRRGAFCLTSTWDCAGPEGRHLLLAQAVIRAATETHPFALSHGTAAAVHGLPVARRLLDTVHVSVPPALARHHRGARDVRRYAVSLGPDDVTTVGGLPVTIVARTLADCLRHLPMIDAVPIADAALHARRVSLEQVRAALEHQARWPYAAVGALALGVVDGRRETPLESRSCVVMHRHGLPLPVPQLAIYDGRGRFVGRVDFAWMEHGVVGEADGRVKYLASPDETREAEKDRQAELEALGLIVVRWDARHLYGPDPVLVRRLRAALARGDGAAFRGRAA